MNAERGNARQYRDRMRRAGFRSVRIWVPDTRQPGFAEECRRQSRALRGDPLEAETLAWIEAATDTDGWEA